MHRDEWRFGLVGKAQLPSPTPYYYLPDGEETHTAALVAMELRHLLGGATTIAGSGGVPGVVRNVGLHERSGDIALYDFEADVSTFPFSYRALEDLAEECAGGPRRAFAPMDDDNLVAAEAVALTDVRGQAPCRPSPAARGPWRSRTDPRAPGRLRLTMP